MPIDPQAGSRFGTEAMPQVQRDEETSAEIRQLLETGDVADLFTPTGKILKRWFTADEKDRVQGEMPMKGPPPNFDGETCDFCRGMCRFRQCSACQGEAIKPHLRPRPEVTAPANPDK